MSKKTKKRTIGPVVELMLLSIILTVINVILYLASEMTFGVMIKPKK